MVAWDRLAEVDGSGALPGDCRSWVALVDKGGDEEVDRLTLSSVVEGVMRSRQLGWLVVGVVTLKSIVDT